MHRSCCSPQLLVVIIGFLLYPEPNCTFIQTQILLFHSSDNTMSVTPDVVIHGRATMDQMGAGNGLSREVWGGLWNSKICGETLIAKCMKLNAKITLKKGC